MKYIQENVASALFFSVISAQLIFTLQILTLCFQFSGKRYHTRHHHFADGERSTSVRGSKGLCKSFQKR